MDPLVVRTDAFAPGFQSLIHFDIAGYGGICAAGQCQSGSLFDTAKVRLEFRRSELPLMGFFLRRLGIRQTYRSRFLSQSLRAL